MPGRECRVVHCLAALGQYARVDVIDDHDATAVAALIRGGQCTPLEAVEAAISRIEERNGALNAVIHERFERAAAEAASTDLPDGPFKGVPLCIKDAVCHTADDPFHVGMQVLRNRQWRAPDDSELARRFRAAGFVVVGRTNTPELAGSATTEPLAYGPTRNPWDNARSPGGSSGGSASAVAAGMVPVAHGNDMGGSIRIPASACGLVGLKPTRARTSLGPNFGEYWGPLTSEGVLTRTVRDAASVLDSIAGPAPGDPYSAPSPPRALALEVGAQVRPLRIGVRTSIPPHGEACPEGLAAVGRTIEVLEELGHHVADASPSALEDPDLLSGFRAVVSVGTAREIQRFATLSGLPIEAEDVEPLTWQKVVIGREVTGQQYAEAIDSFHRAARRMSAWWEEGWDLMLTPTLGILPPLVGEAGPLAPPADVATISSQMSMFTKPANATGQPAISLPVARTVDNLPVGIQLMADHFREDILVRVGAQLEAAMAWSTRPVPR